MSAPVTSSGGSPSRSRSDQQGHRAGELELGQRDAPVGDECDGRSRQPLERRPDRRSAPAGPRRPRPSTPAPPWASTGRRSADRARPRRRRRRWRRAGSCRRCPGPRPRAGTRTPDRSPPRRSAPRRPQPPAFRTRSPTPATAASARPRSPPGRCRRRSSRSAGSQPAASAAASRSSPSATNRPARSRSRRRWMSLRTSLSCALSWLVIMVMQRKRAPSLWGAAPEWRCWWSAGLSLSRQPAPHGRARQSVGRYRRR